MNAVFILSGLGIFSLLTEIFNLRKILFPVVVAGLIAASVFPLMDWNTARTYYNDMLLFDNYAISFSILLSVVALLWFTMSKDYLQNNTHVTDHFALLLFALVGAVFMVSYHNMVMLFLGIETLSVSLYVLAGSRMKDILSNEAGFKYFLMGAFATGFLLFGIALIYGSTGSFHLIEIKKAMISGNFEFEALLYTGILMVLVGLAFKISAAPFHFWVPDVYQGSPTVVTAFMSTIVKIAAFAAFFRLFYICFSSVADRWTDVVLVITVITLVVSNITAVYQKNVKRMLAYSSVAHAGYLLIALVTMNDASHGMILYYLAAYSAATLGAFAVLHCIEKENNQATVDAFDGMAKQSPFLTFTMSVSLLSLAGIPPLAGFFAKYMIFTQALQQGYMGLVILAICASLVGVYYYFQLVIAMYFKEGAAVRVHVTLFMKFLLILLTLISFMLGIFPGWLAAIR